MTATATTLAYELVEDWARLPGDWTFHEVADVAVDENDHLYVFSRGEHPLTVFAPDGRFDRAWGEGLFTRPHGITLGPNDDLYLVDEGAHCIRHFTRDGRELGAIGTCGKPAASYSGRPFARCTHLAIHPVSGNLYVTDGYANARVHVFSPDGTPLFGWGQPGTDPGEFNVPHNIAIDAEGLVYVADRENHRVQVFDATGRFERQLVNLHRPTGLHIDRRSDLVYVGEIGPVYPNNKSAPNLGPRVSVFDKSGTRVARIGDVLGEGPGQFTGPHGIDTNSRGDVFIGEVSWTLYGQLLEPKREIRSLRLLRRT